MTPDWSWYEWTWLAAIFESLVAPVVLTVGSLSLWKRTRSKILALASAGFALALLGGAYRTYAFLYAGVLCDAGQNLPNMQRFVECSNLHAAYGNAVAATGLVASGVLFLVYAFRK